MTHRRADRSEAPSALASLTTQRSEPGRGKKAKDQKIKSPTNTRCVSLGLKKVGRFSGDDSGIRRVMERGVDGGVYLLLFSRASPR